MSEDLPNGWLELTLDQTGSWSSGGTPSRQHQEYFASGAIPWVKSGDLPDGSILKTDECITDLGLQNSSAKLMPAGTISMALYGATIGKLGVMSFPAATNQACVNVIPDTRLVEPQYLFWYLFSERTAFIEKGKGGAQPNISQEIVRAHPFNLAPLAEQRRIVAKLGGIFAQLSTSTHSLSKISKTLPRFRRSVLAAAFSGRLTADWRADAIDDEKFPPTWKKRRLDSLFEIKSGGTPSRTNKKYYEGGTIPWIKTGELKNQDITAAEEFITRRAIEESNAKVFPVGTILIAMYGEGKTRGQVGRLTFPAATNQACAALVNTRLPDVTNQYVFTYLLGQYYQLRAEAVGGNQPNLNLSIVKNWELALPPLEEQIEILRRTHELLGLAAKLETRFTQAQIYVDRIRKSTLAKAFRGELFPTEAELAEAEGRAFEPASELFERVQSHQTGPKHPKRHE